jgi:hypothetical protein
MMGTATRRLYFGRFRQKGHLKVSFVALSMAQANNRQQRDLRAWRRCRRQSLVSLMQNHVRGLLLVGPEGGVSQTPSECF